MWECTLFVRTLLSLRLSTATVLFSSIEQPCSFCSLQLPFQWSHFEWIKSRIRLGEGGRNLSGPKSSLFQCHMHVPETPCRDCSGFPPPLLRCGPWACLCTTSSLLALLAAFTETRALPPSEAFLNPLTPGGWLCLCAPFLTAAAEHRDLPAAPGDYSPPPQPGQHGGERWSRSDACARLYVELRAPVRGAARACAQAARGGRAAWRSGALCPATSSPSCSPSCARTASRAPRAPSPGRRRRWAGREGTGGRGGRLSDWLTDWLTRPVSWFRRSRTPTQPPSWTSSVTGWSKYPSGRGDRAYRERSGAEGRLRRAAGHPPAPAAVRPSPRSPQPSLPSCRSPAAKKRKFVPNGPQAKRKPSSSSDDSSSEEDETPPAKKPGGVCERP